MQFFKKGTNAPIGNGGGTCKTIKDVEKLIHTSIGTIEIGSITELPRIGNSGNTFYSGDGYTLNSLGLPNPGMEYYKSYLPIMVGMIAGAGKKSIVNVVGFSMEEYALLTRFAFDAGADYVVENYGCPNIYVEGIQKGILSYDIDALKRTTINVLSKNPKEAKAGRIGIKLSPIPDPLHIAKIASFLNSFLDVPTQNGIGFIGFIETQNTIPNCYDEEDSAALISNVDGLAGMAGKWVFPMALGQVKQFYKLLNPSIKIIGIGGIVSAKHMEKMFRNGACFVQITSPYFTTENPAVFDELTAEFLMLPQH